MLPLVVVNPESAGGNTRREWPKIASDLATHFGPFDVKFTNTPGEAIQIAGDAARKGTELIIACGGDGTISEVANGILAAAGNSVLGILPSGTGGDIRKTISIPARSSDAAKILRTGCTRKMDVGRVTFTNPLGELDSRYFLGVASFGMSAEVISRVKDGGPDWLPPASPKWLTGRVSFGLAMLKTAVTTKPSKVIVQLDDAHEHLMTVTNLCIANARYFGGGMKIAPNAKLSDGKFDVVSIGDLGAGKILANAPRLYAGAHLSMQGVDHALAAKITARASDDNQRIDLEVDGELPGHLPATFQIVAQALRVRCPANSF